MKLYNVEQGTTEWLRLRSGIPTASMFEKIITPGGKKSDSQEKYMYVLLAERIMGHPVKDHVSMWQQRGKEMEREAVAFYEFQREMKTIPIGFVSNDTCTIGASPDRFVGEDGCLEIKCPKEAVHMMYLLRSGSAYKEYMVQSQGQLWLSGRKWVDLLSYHPELPWALQRISRDDGFIEPMSKMVEAFSRELEALAIKHEELMSGNWLSIA